MSLPHSSRASAPSSPPCTSYTGLLIPFDIAARIVPLRDAATLFALLMALSNFASTLAEGLGGQLYEWLRDEFGSMTASRTMLLLGIVIVSTCWIAVPRLRRDVPQWWD